MASTSGKKMQVDPELVGFAREFRRRREAAGLNQSQLARLVNVASSYISHIERARTRCRRDFTMRVDKALNAGGELVKSWDELVEVLNTIKYPTYFVKFPKAEIMANMVRSYEAALVYGIFQTEAYARFLLPNDEDFQNRMRRQEILKKNPPPYLSVVMHESVLYAEVDSPKTMHDQLEYLIELSHHERINIQIAPLDQYRRVLSSSFSIATLPDQSQVVNSETAYGGVTTTKPHEIEQTVESFVTLQAEALSAKETRALIRKVIDERWT